MVTFKINILLYKDNLNRCTQKLRALDLTTQLQKSTLRCPHLC